MIKVTYAIKYNIIIKKIMFVVYIRSMSTYTDHQLDVQYKNGQYHMFRPVGFHNTYNEAYLWLLSVGKSLTETFYNYSTQGCAFVIIKQSNQDTDSFGDSLDDDDLSLYFVNRSRYHYVFSEESYQMCLNEHLMFYSYDWDSPFPIWLKYVQDDGTIVTGCTLEHFIEVQEMNTYIKNNVATKKKELVNFKKFLKDGNVKHLFAEPQLASPIKEEADEDEEEADEDEEEADEDEEEAEEEAEEDEGDEQV
jgi:hypothetical protein